MNHYSYRQERSFTLVVLASLLTLLLPTPVHAQQQPSSSTTPLSPSGPGGGGGGSGSSLSIESVMFEYQAATSNARRIDYELSKIMIRDPNATRIIIATSSDIGAIVQLKAVLGQATIIDGRLADLAKALVNNAYPCHGGTRLGQRFEAFAFSTKSTTSTATPQGILPGLLPFLTGNASAIQTLIQTIANVGTVTETIAPAPGALQDTVLINLVAGGFPGAPGHVFVPSLYAPDIIYSSFKDTLIGQRLSTLETDRRTLIQAADKKLLSPACQYTGDPKSAGDQNLAKMNQATITQVTTEVTAASALVDAFEASLFGGGGAASNPATPGAATGAPTNPTSTPLTTTTPGAPGATTPNSPAAGPPTASAIAGPSPQGGSALQQMLYADALLRQLGLGTDNDTNKRLPIYFVSVHSLESGGTALTKGGFFGGTHVYYSGGAVATFSVFGGGGAIICSGVSYSYRGSVYEGRMTDAFNDVADPQAGTPGKQDDLPIVNNYTSSCGRSALGATNVTTVPTSTP